MEAAFWADQYRGLVGPGNRLHERRATFLVGENQRSVLGPVLQQPIERHGVAEFGKRRPLALFGRLDHVRAQPLGIKLVRSEEHTSELQSLMTSSYAVFCLQKK